MSVELTAKVVSDTVKEGFERMRRYRRARALFIKDYVGHYFRAEHGMTGEMPINLVFLAIHALVPSLIQREGFNKVLTDFLQQKDYVEMLGLALNRLQKKLRLKDVLRAAVVDMCFGFTVLKTSIAADGMLLPVADDLDVPLGQVFTDLVSLDDFTFDPTATAFDKSSFMGHRVRVPRQTLLEYDWDEDVVNALPSASEHPTESQWVQSLTQDGKKSAKMHELQDHVYIVEVHVPDANAILYVPDPYQTTFDDFVHVQEYVGPDGGPYTIGSLTQPVPNNPFPIAPVGVWRDLNDMANIIFKKYMNQSERQKDILLYRPELADVADAIRTALDGEAIACNDPKGINAVSYGGQNPENQAMVQELRGWFNYVAGNPDQLMGIGTSADTATEYQGNQANAVVRIEDMRSMIADVHADISKKQAWFLHTDPLMFDAGKPGIPLIRRVTGGQEVQMYLTPEQRQGDWLDFTFEIVKRSMTVLEPNLRSKRLMEFYTSVVPSLAQSAMVMTQMGIQFNLPRALMQAAEEMGIDEAVQEVFQDPEFQKRLNIMMQMGPQPTGKAELQGILQNGGSPMRGNLAGPGTETRQQQQASAAEGQSAMGFGGNQWL